MHSYYVLKFACFLAVCQLCWWHRESCTRRLYKSTCTRNFTVCCAFLDKLFLVQETCIKTCTSFLYIILDCAPPALWQQSIYVINICVFCRGLVPLHNACSYGHFEVTELLLKVRKFAYLVLNEIIYLFMIVVSSFPCF